MIITSSKFQSDPNGLLNRYPDQFVSKKEKETEDWAKYNMDFFASEAYKQFTNNCKTFANNYKLVKGILTRADFYDVEPETKTLVDTLEKDMDLPSFVKHYSIMDPCINVLLGELSQRPDNVRVKAYDNDSKSEELQYRTEVLQKFILDASRAKVIDKLVRSGQLDPNNLSQEEYESLMQQVDEEAYENVKDDLMNYTSEAESWANHMLEALKVEFNIKEKSEEAFRDLLICAREYYHILKDNSKTGFRVEALNPKNVWKLATADKKYMKEAYAGGLVEVLEISEIIDKYDLSKKEIDHLTNAAKGIGYGYNVRESNLVKSNPTTGPDSVTYDTYDQLVEQYRMAFESYLRSDGSGDDNDYFGLANTVTSFGTKYVVVTAYWKSKEKIGKLTYLDSEGNIQTTIVDENYKTIPEEVSIEWGYINRWYKGIKIGTDIYRVEPFDLLDYCPIIGVIFESKNTEARSLVDLMKQYQTIVNVCYNQIFKLLGEDAGKVLVTSLRTIPKLKGQDNQDAINSFEMMAREKRMILLDDSPENMKGTTGFNQHSVQDWSQAESISYRKDLAERTKLECWQLVGFNPERLANMSASQTATGTQAALTQSYAQTEHYFAQHEYVLNDLYQAMIDAAQYTLLNNPQSTLSYVNSQGESQFLEFNGENISMRDLKVFVTSRAADKRVFDQMQQLAQAAMQNGASLYDVFVLFNSNSIRQAQHVFKTLKEEQQKLQEQQAQIEQQKIEQAQAQFEKQLEYNEYVRNSEMENENYNKELDRLSNERRAIISATGFGKVESEDSNANGIPDVLEASRVANEQIATQNDHANNLQKLNLEKQKLDTSKQLELEKIKNEKEKLKVEREKIEAQKWIAKENKTAAELKAKQAKAKSKKK